MTEQAPPKPATGINDEDQPLDPAVERVRRKMMRLMAVSVGIMMVGLMAVLFAIVYKISTPDEASAPLDADFESVLALPAGSRVVSHNLSGDRLSLLVEHEGGRQTILLFDTILRRVTGRIEVATQ